MTVSASTPRIRLTRALFLLLLLLVALSGDRRIDGAAGVLAQGAGFVLVVAGTLWRMWASVFVAGRKDVELVMDGPYAACRHPLYLGSLAAGVGLGLATRSVVLLLATPLALGVALGMAIRREERYLRARHGVAWESYRDRVPALLPRRLPPAPAGLRPVDVQVYRKAFLDAAAVLLLWLAIVATDALRQLGLWTAPLLLP